MNEQLAAKIRTAPNLPSMPAIAIQILELAQKREVDMAEIARIISKDPALSGKILRTVNSSFYGRGQNVGTISHALVILGLQSVKTLVLGFTLVSNLSQGRSKGFKHLQYWKRSIFAATAARAFAARLELRHQEEAFLATLLADIGMLVLDQVLGEEYGAVYEKVKSHADLLAAERAALDASHAEVGGMLAELWKLPAILSVPIAKHHDPESVNDPGLRRLAELVSLAGRCADVFLDADAAPAIAEIRTVVLERYQIGEADADAILADIGRRTRDIANLFEINIGSVAEYEAILKRANEALINITLQTQQHASALAQQATSLQQQNQQLQHKASTDALTGLVNRARFDELLAEQLSAAVQHDRPLALLMLDLDHFKAVNDRHGHPAGDAVLKSIAAVVMQCSRKHDIAARYGGEELAIIAPDSERSHAAVLAETMRRCIAARPINAGRSQIRVTASIGVALYEPGSPLRLPARLIKAADLALYNAKHSGRNCVRIFSLREASSATSMAAPPDSAPDHAAA